ncbi:HlyD family secretion protein [Pelosinus sp. sgz500959]|uniref:HlyD family secretion protein n=1 Tax=Pelosinus sp. sgz500959 TaxID=3242472 RepID=UPI003670101E
MEDKAQDQNGGKSKIIVGLLIFFLLIGIAGGGWWWYQSTKYVSTDDARIGGTIVSVSAKIPGRIIEVLVKEGEQVKAGQVVARIDAREVAAQQAQAKAAVAVAKAKYEELIAGSRPQEIGQARFGADQAQAGVDQARANLDNAAKNYERMQALYQQGAISSSQIDNAQTAYHVAKEVLRAAQEGVNVAGQKLDLSVSGTREETIRGAEAQLKQAEAALDAVVVLGDYTTIVSPVTGTVALKSVNPGEVVAAAQPLFSIVDLSDVWLNTRIEETKLAKIKVGQKVEYTIDGYPGRNFEGTVYEVGTAANSVFALIPTENASSNFTKVTQRIGVKITLPNEGDLVFRPGMSAIVKIHLE